MTGPTVTWPRDRFPVDTTRTGWSTPEAFLNGLTAFTAYLEAPLLSASQNDYNPAGLAGKNFVSIGASVDINITGLVSHQQGEAKFLFNRGPGTITLVNNSGLSLPENRFSAAQDLTILPNEGMLIIQDPQAIRWRFSANGITDIEGRIPYPTLTAALASVPLGSSFFETAGYAAVGDRGAGMYISIPGPGTDPRHVQAATGEWFQLASDIFLPQQFGAVADGVTNTTAAIVDWWAALQVSNRIGLWPTGEYLCNEGQIEWVNTTSAFIPGPRIYTEQNVWLVYANFADKPMLSIHNMVSFQFIQGGHLGALNFQDPNILTPATATVTITIASPGIISWAGHTFTAGSKVYFTTTGTLPTGIIAEQDYFVCAPIVPGVSFAITTYDGGSAITTSGSQSGVQTGTQIFGRHGLRLSGVQNMTIGYLYAGARGLTTATAARLHGDLVHIWNRLLSGGNPDTSHVFSVIFEGIDTSAQFYDRIWGWTLNNDSEGQGFTGCYIYQLRNLFGNKGVWRHSGAGNFCFLISCISPKGWALDFGANQGGTTRTFIEAVELDAPEYGARISGNTQLVMRGRCNHRYNDNISDIHLPEVGVPYPKQVLSIGGSSTTNELEIVIVERVQPNVLNLAFITGVAGSNLAPADPDLSALNGQSLTLTASSGGFAVTYNFTASVSGQKAALIAAALAQGFNVSGISTGLRIARNDGINFEITTSNAAVDAVIGSPSGMFSNFVRGAGGTNLTGDPDLSALVGANIRAEVGISGTTVNYTFTNAASGQAAALIAAFNASGFVSFGTAQGLLISHDSADTFIVVISGPAKSITGITQANPASVTVASHAWTSGNAVFIDGVVGMTGVNGGSYTITSTGANTFTIPLNTLAFPAYISGGIATNLSIAAAAVTAMGIASSTESICGVPYSEGHFGALYDFNSDPNISVITIRTSPLADLQILPDTAVYPTNLHNSCNGIVVKRNDYEVVNTNRTYQVRANISASGQISNTGLGTTTADIPYSVETRDPLSVFDPTTYYYRIPHRGLYRVRMEIRLTGLAINTAVQLAVVEYPAGGGAGAIRQTSILRSVNTSAQSYVLDAIIDCQTAGNFLAANGQQGTGAPVTVDAGTGVSVTNILDIYPLGF